MKNIIVVLIITMVMVGCKSNDKIETPNKVFSSFADAFTKKDLGRMRLLCTMDSKTSLDILEKQSKKMNMASMKHFDTSNISIGEPVIEGDDAVLPIKEKESGVTIDFPLKKEDGVWKIAFDVNTLYNLFNETVQKNELDQRIPGLDSMMKRYKDINLDSFGEELMKKNDTVRLKH